MSSVDRAASAVERGWPGDDAVDWSVWSDRHPSVQRLRRLFEYNHLPPRLQNVSRPFALAALSMFDVGVPDCPELTEALRKLWEAKNLAVVAVARPEG